MANEAIKQPIINDVKAIFFFFFKVHNQFTNYQLKLVFKPYESAFFFFSTVAQGSWAK